MKTIIAGSRDGVTYQDIVNAVNQCGWGITEVVSGRARGADQFGEQWAIQRNVPIKMFPANWDLNGRRAGYIRNLDMADYADAAIVCWNGVSRGSQHMINVAKQQGLRVYVYRTDENNQ